MTTKSKMKFCGYNEGETDEDGVEDDTELENGNGGHLGREVGVASRFQMVPVVVEMAWWVAPSRVRIFSTACGFEVGILCAAMVVLVLIVIVVMAMVVMVMVLM